MRQLGLRGAGGCDGAGRVRRSISAYPAPIPEQEASPAALESITRTRPFSQCPKFAGAGGNDYSVWGASGGLSRLTRAESQPAFAKGVNSVIVPHDQPCDGTHPT